MAPPTPAALIPHPWGALVLDQLVDVVLSAVLAGGHLKNEGNAEQGLLGVSVCHNLWHRGEWVRRGLSP